MRPYYLAFLIAMPVLSQTNLELMQNLANNETHGQVIKTFDIPDKETAISFKYSFKEMELRPNQVLYFHVPEKYSQHPVSQIAFAHRQIGYAQTYDRNPGLTSALIYTKDMPGDELRYWAGHSSGKLGAKYAEYRRSPELDSLYEWPRMGHKGINNKNKDTTLIRASAIRIQNVGSSKIYLSEVYLETIPPKAGVYQEVIFTPKSTFGDPVTMDGRYYGGGQNQRGTFPQALRLGSDNRRGSPASLPSNMILDRNNLKITLPTGSKIRSVDVMCGDTHPDYVRNSDGGWGTQGNAKLTFSVKNKNTGAERILLKDKNVGPQGVITASDLDDSLTIEDGDELIISNQRNTSTTYIMALRIGYDQ